MDTENKIPESVARVVERVDESNKWLSDNYHSEFVEVWRAHKCRTQPIMVKTRKGKDEEDLTRTNVAMPDINVIVRRNTARMTAQPPSNRYLVPDNPLYPDLKPSDLAERLSAWNLMQYDRSGENKEHRLHVQQEETFGFSVMKHYWKLISVDRVFRYKLAPALPREILLGATSQFSEDEIAQEVAMKGKLVGDNELPDLMSRYGKEIVRRMRIPRFEGPVGKMVFIGDFFPEPGFSCVDESRYLVQQYWEGKQWLDEWREDTFFHPDTDEELPVFDEEAVKELLEDTRDAKAMSAASDSKDLRQEMWDAMGKSNPDVQRSERLVPGHRFHIYEQHTKDDQGRYGILFVANKKWCLNVKDEKGDPIPYPYPFDLNGMSQFTEFVGLPDLISGIGDSTPRLLRFLYQLHNTVVNQRTDLINNILRRVVFRKNRADLPDQPVERSQFRVYDVKDPSDYSIPQEADVPTSAFNQEESVIRMMAMADPSLTNMESATQVTGGAKGTATAATLQARSIEGLTQHKLDNLHIYNGTVAIKKLCMLQQMATDPIEVPARYVRSEALLKQLGEAASFKIDPYSLQSDIEAVPEENSTLSQDDEFRRMAAENMYRFAAEDPVIWNKRYAAKMMAKTLRGVDPNQAVNPEPDPNAPPPPPEVRVSLSISMKFEELQPGTQQAILSRAGLPFDMAEAQSKEEHKAIIDLGDAADAAAKLAEPVKGSEGMNGVPEQSATPVAG